MKKLLVRWSTLLLLLVLSGCGTDNREIAVNKAINVMEQATTKIANTRAEVEKAIKKAKEAGGDLSTKEARKDLEEAGKSADELEKLAKGLQAVSNEIDGLKDSVSKEEQEDLRKRYQGRLETAIKRLQDEEKGLDTAMRDAESLNPNVNRAALEPLRKKLEKLNGEFQNLTKRR